MWFTINMVDSVNKERPQGTPLKTALEIGLEKSQGTPLRTALDIGLEKAKATPDVFLPSTEQASENVDTKTQEFLDEQRKILKDKAVKGSVALGAVGAGTIGLNLIGFASIFGGPIVAPFIAGGIVLARHLAKDHAAIQRGEAIKK